MTSIPENAVPVVLYVQPEPGSVLRGERGEKGDPGAGIVSRIQQARFAPGATCDQTVWTFTGHSVQVTLMAGEAVLIDVAGRFGHSGSGAVVHFTLYRGNADLTPASCSGLDSPRSIDPNYTEPFSFSLLDAPGAGTFDYKLMMRVHNGVAHLGKRPSDAVMNIGTSITQTIFKCA